MQINSTKARIQAGQPVFGCFVRYPNAALIEMLGYTQWDFLVFDGEHGLIEPRDCEDMTRAAELRGVTPIIRVPTNQAHIILRFMDTGAQGLHVPWVNSAAEAEAVVRSVKYFPRGIRGLAGVRPADYGQIGTLGAYVEAANRESLIVVHIETQEAVANLEAIAAVDGIDVIFIGPTDLSQSYGVPGQTKHPLVEAAADKIAEIVLHSDKALGIMAPNFDDAQRWRDRGARYITTTVEALLTPAARGFLNAVRQA